MLFNPRTYPEIYGGMVARVRAASPLTDVNYGSVLSTMLEAAAQEDDEQYFQMLEIIRGYSLDTTTGTDLEDRAFEYGLRRDHSPGRAGMRRCCRNRHSDADRANCAFAGQYPALGDAPDSQDGRFFQCLVMGDYGVGAAYFWRWSLAWGERFCHVHGGSRVGRRGNS